MAWVHQAIARDTDECIEYPFALSYGYGRMWADGRGTAVTHVVLTLTGRPRPEAPRNHALHSCPDGDNPACCNPRHLRWGTQMDNSGDMISRGRIGYGTALGEANPAAVLTDDLVRSLRRERESTGESYAVLAKRHGLKTYAVWAAITGRTWSHVT